MSIPVIASEAKQSSFVATSKKAGLLRRFAPRNDDEKAVPLNRLARIRHRRRQAAIHRNRLAVDVARLVARQEQSHRREFMRLAGALERIELADLVLGAALLGAVEHGL